MAETYWQSVRSHRLSPPMAPGSVPVLRPCIDGRTRHGRDVPAVVIVLAQRPQQRFASCRFSEHHSTARHAIWLHAAIDGKQLSQLASYFRFGLHAAPFRLATGRVGFHVTSVHSIEVLLTMFASREKRALDGGFPRAVARRLAPSDALYWLHMPLQPAAPNPLKSAFYLSSSALQQISFSYPRPQPF
jgi:hypothetical protein